MLEDREAGWAVPGVPRPREHDWTATPDVDALERAVEQVLATSPNALSPSHALARAERLLRLQERLSAAGLAAVADVDLRDLWADAEAGSTRTWLRSLPCGDTGQLSTCRALQPWPLLRGALAAGHLSLRTALTVARALHRVPDAVPDDQLEAVLVDGLADVLSVWTGAACLEPTAQQESSFRDRRRRLADVASAALTDTWSTPADRLEPAFLLVAEVLTPAEVTAGLGLLVDALAPEASLDDVAEQCYRDRSTVLRRRASGMWSLRAELTPEAGLLLHAHLTAARRHEAPRREGGLDAVFGTPGDNDGPAAAATDDIPPAAPDRPGDHDHAAHTDPDSDAHTDPDGAAPTDGAVDANPTADAASESHPDPNPTPTPTTPSARPDPGRPRPGADATSRAPPWAPPSSVTTTPSPGCSVSSVPPGPAPGGHRPPPSSP